MPDLKQHPLSAAFPAMDDATFAELRADIAANGLHMSIVLYDGEVLDGWHRYTACKQTGAEPHFEALEGDEDAARKFVVGANLKRRHLNGSQRALIAGRFATMPHGGDRGNQHTGGKRQVATLPLASKETRDAAAEQLNVAPRAVTDARTVLATNDAALIAKVEAGEMSVANAAKEVRANTPKAAPRKPKPAATTAAFVDVGPQSLAAWARLPVPMQHASLAHRDPAASLNRQNAGEDDNAIDWAKWTWNPVTGCLHNCPYCYARDIAERFAGTAAYPQGFAPTLHPNRLAAPINGRPRDNDDPRERRIFVCSMADLFGRWVPPAWIETVLGICRDAPAWEFLMLTKFPKRMAEFDIPPNVWMGTSVDCQARVDAAEAAFAKVNARVKWLSCEPLIEPLKFRRLDLFDLLVIGGASRSSKTPQWIPPFRWLDDLMGQANGADCNVFLKSNLYLKEAPRGPRYRFADKAPEVFHYLARASSPNEQANAA